MHKVNDTTRMLTVIGLIIEGIALSVYALSAAILTNLTEDAFAATMNGDAAVRAQMIEVMHILGTVVLVVATVLFIVFMVNLVLFTKLIKGHYDERAAHRVLFYQAVWGCVSLLFNMITGVLYIMAAVKALTGGRNRAPATK